MTHEKQSKGKERGIVCSLIDTHLQTLATLDHFEKVLTNLRFEGGAFIGKNIKEAAQAAASFEEEIVLHMDLEERVIFPFVESRLPKLKRVIQHIHTEHKDFRRSLNRFKKLLAKLRRTKDVHSRSKTAGDVRYAGTYLICHLRTHHQMETMSVYKFIETELSPETKDDLRIKTRNWLKNHSEVP